MNIEKKQIDALDMELTLSIGKDDYSPVEKKKLNEQRKTAEFKGFRKGMVPMSLIQHVYGEQILVSAVNEIISKELNDFIKENDLKIIGEPLSSEDQPENEWNDGNDFTFKFDIATAPELNFEISKEDKIPYYKIEATDQGRDEMKTNILRQYGSLQEGDSAKEEDYIIADFEQEGKKIEGSYVTVSKVDDSCKSLFIGAKAGDKINVDVNKAFSDENDRASVLKLKKNDLDELNPEFTMTVVNVKTFVPAEPVQETFDKVFGKDKVKSEAEFDEEIAKRLEGNYVQEADYRFSKDVRTYFVNKASITLPEDFLKRWLFSVNEGKYSKEDIEKEFDAFLADFRWKMIRDYVIKKFDVKITDQDMKDAAEGYVAYQYAMYGLSDVPHEQIHAAAHQVLADEKQAQRIEEQVEDQKVVAAFRDAVTLSEENITVEKFRDLK
jgi:trigger factor